MLALRKLAVATPRPILIRALMQCRVHVTRAVQDMDDFGNVVKEFSGLVRATDGDRFCTLYFYEPAKKNLAESKVWLHCSCPYYTYHIEVVNALKKSSDVINSNGELPVIRNPRMIPHMCKHLVALSKLALVAKYKTIGRLKIEEEEAQKFFEQQEKERKFGKKNVPPAKTLKRPGEPAERPAAGPAPRRPTPVKPGPKTPQRPAARPVAGPKAPKPIRRPGQR